MARGPVHFELPSRGGDRARRFGHPGRPFSDPRLTGPGHGRARAGEHRDRVGISVPRESGDMPRSVATGPGGPDGRAPLPQAGGLARCTEAECDRFRIVRSGESAGA